MADAAMRMAMRDVIIRCTLQCCNSRSPWPLAKRPIAATDNLQQTLYFKFGSDPEIIYLALTLASLLDVNFRPVSKRIDGRLGQGCHLGWALLK